ncbi:MAG: thioredoxin family protein [Planctomycetes bacterium]|nr:thioredoxin family protein [Planctomycetota bacterium]
MTHIKILGTGCPKCRQLADNAAAAAEQLGTECEIEKITELSEIMQHGVMLTPGLVIDDEVRASGKVPSVEEIKSMLQDS